MMMMKKLLLTILAMTMIIGIEFANSNIHRADICASSGRRPGGVAIPFARKFFALQDVIFVTPNHEYFDTTRIFNLTRSGSIGEEQAVAIRDLLPDDRLALSSSSLNRNRNRNILWAFVYDVSIEHCRAIERHSADKDNDYNEDEDTDDNNSIDNDRPIDSQIDFARYCSRVDNLAGLVVAAVAAPDRPLLFMRHNARKFVSVSDQYNFIEIRALLKHLDRYGYTSSLTFVQATDRFLSTHYGRLAELCVTSVRHRGRYIVPLPLWNEMLDDDLFVTDCLPSLRSYTSVIDLPMSRTHEASLFAITNMGLVDQIEIDAKAAQIDVIKSFTAKEFFNCYHNSTVVKTTSISRSNSRNNLEAYEPISDLDFAPRNPNDLMQKKSPQQQQQPLSPQIQMRSFDQFDGQKEGKQRGLGGGGGIENEENNAGHFGRGWFTALALISVMLLFTVFGYLHISGRVDGRQWAATINQSIFEPMNRVYERVRSKFEPNIGNDSSIAAVAAAKNRTDSNFDAKTTAAKSNFSMRNLSQLISIRKKLPVKEEIVVDQKRMVSTATLTATPTMLEDDEDSAVSIIASSGGSSSSVGVSTLAREQTKVAKNHYFKPQILSISSTTHTRKD